MDYFSVKFVNQSKSKFAIFSGTWPNQKNQTRRIKWLPSSEGQSWFKVLTELVRVIAILKWPLAFCFIPTHVLLIQGRPADLNMLCDIHMTTQDSYGDNICLVMGWISSGSSKLQKRFMHPSYKVMQKSEAERTQPPENTWFYIFFPLFQITWFHSLNNNGGNCFFQNTGEGREEVLIQERLLWLQTVINCYSVPD